MPERCALCLDDKNISGICHGCRSKLENAKRDADRWKKQAEAWRLSYWRIFNERNREAERKRRTGKQ